MNLEDLKNCDPVLNWNFDLVYLEDGSEKVSYETLKVSAADGKMTVTQFVTDRNGILDLRGCFVALRVYSSKPSALFDIYYQLGKLLDVSFSLDGELAGCEPMKLVLTYEATLSDIDREKTE